MTNSKRTQLLLQALARRLSGREDCKQIQFQIGIGTLIPDDNPVRFLIPEAVAKNYIFFQPDLFVYRDMHHRKDIDKFRPADLVILKYFPELNLGPDDQGKIGRVHV